MSYDIAEKSIHDGSPVELYRFVMGSERWTVTSGDTAIAYDGLTYEPATIKRNEISQSASTSRTGIQITAPIDFPVATKFKFGPPGAVINLTVFRQHRNDVGSETVVIWRGRVLE